MLTANGVEFTIGKTYWHTGVNEWRTDVEIRDGDKLAALKVCTPGTVRQDQVMLCVEKSMQQWNYWGEKPVKAALKGGVT